jgi:phage/plasmid-associated DNA primase
MPTSAQKIESSGTSCPGVLTKLLSLFPALWLRRHFVQSPAMHHAKSEWLKGASVLHAFTHEMCHSTPPQDVDATKLYEYYRRNLGASSPASTPLAKERFLHDVRTLLPPAVVGSALARAVSPPEGWRPGRVRFG